MRNVVRKIRSVLALPEKIGSDFSRLRYFTRAETLTMSLLSTSTSGISKDLHCDEEIIVSLTTYGRRIHDVHLTIESLMRQTRQANRIVLWLAFEYQGSELPMSLQLQIKRGLEVRYCEDIRSYKKLIPALIAFPSSVIITVDDDLLYDSDFLDKFVLAYKKDNSKIYFNRGHRMRFSANGELSKYLDWEWEYSDQKISPLNFPTGMGGVLYPPNSFVEAVFDKEVFMKISPSADDVWFKAMSILKGKLSQKLITRNPSGIEGVENLDVQDVALGRINNIQNQNDVQIKSVFERYNVYSLLKDSRGD